MRGLVGVMAAGIALSHPLPLADATSSFTAVPGSPFHTPAFPGFVAFSPNGRLLAAADDPDKLSAVTEYLVAPDGTLSAVRDTPEQDGTNSFGPASVSYSPNGRLLAVVNFSNNTVVMYSVGQRGRLQRVARVRSPDPEWGAFGQGGRLFAVVGGEGVVTIYTVEHNGGLRKAPGSPLEVADYPGLDAVAFTPNGDYIAAVDSGPPHGGVYVFSLDAAGAVTQIPGSPFDRYGGGMRSLAISPNGKFLAAGGYDYSNVAVFSVGSTGALAKVSGSPFRSGGGGEPDGEAFSPNGRLLAVADSSGNDVAVFAVTANGRLRKPELVKSSTPLPHGEPYIGPDSVTFSPNGRLLAVANYGDAYISVFRVP